MTTFSSTQYLILFYCVLSLLPDPSNSVAQNHVGFSFVCPTSHCMRGHLLNVRFTYLLGVYAYVVDVLVMGEGRWGVYVCRFICPCMERPEVSLKSHIACILKFDLILEPWAYQLG